MPKAALSFAGHAYGICQRAVNVCKIFGADVLLQQAFLGAPKEQALSKCL
jgi:hypothetical protein